MYVSAYVCPCLGGCLCLCPRNYTNITFIHLYIRYRWYHTHTTTSLPDVIIPMRSVAIPKANKLPIKVGFGRLDTNWHIVKFSPLCNFCMDRETKCYTYNKCLVTPRPKYHSVNLASTSTYKQIPFYHFLFNFVSRSVFFFFFFSYETEKISMHVK